MDLKLTPEAVKQLRSDAGLSQKEFWGRIGITQSGGSRYESSARGIPELIQLMLLLVYGTEQEAQDILRYLRSGATPRKQ